MPDTSMQAFVHSSHSATCANTRAGSTSGTPSLTCASVSNMISAYGGIRWGTGMVREFQYEKTQSRIGASPWDAPLQFIENSPLFWIERINTPYLTIHNDADDAVPWYQGIEYFLALRRLGKECYLLNYNGEKHNLGNPANARDFAVRMFQFFEHHYASTITQHKTIAVSVPRTAGPLRIIVAARQGFGRSKTAHCSR